MMSGQLFYEIARIVSERLMIISNEGAKVAR